MSQERDEALKIAFDVLLKMNIYLSGSCAQEMGERHMAKAWPIAAALLEARADGYKAGMCWHQLAHDPRVPQRLREEAQALREGK